MRQTSAHEQAVQNNLPAQLTPLIGREREIATVCDLLRSPGVRILTLTGTGGIGKTRFALHVGAELLHVFANGVCFVSLAAISEIDLVVPTIAQALGLWETLEQPSFEHLKASLQDQHLLLLLDNFEQVVTAAPLLTELLATSPGLKILVTSRAVLRVYGENVFPIPPLAMPDLACFYVDEDLQRYSAITLFIQQTRAVMPNFQITNMNARAIVEICARLEGLPLAIELAAARIRLLPPPALLERLEHRLHVLTNGACNLPARQQTLRNTIRWSYDLLNAEEQRLFRQLSIFVSGCSLEAIEFLYTIQGNKTVCLLDDVTSLLDKSLLQQTEQADGEPRLSMLETLREFGLECLTTNGELEGSQRARAIYYLALAEKAEAYLVGPEQGKWLDRLEHEYENLRASLRWLIAQAEYVEVDLALRLCAALGRFWMVRGHLCEGRNFLEQVLKAGEQVAAPVRAKALYTAGMLEGLQGNLAHTDVLCREGLELFQAQNATEGIAASLWTLGYAAMERGDYAGAHTLAEKALTLARETDSIWCIACSLAALASLAFHQAEYGRARALIEESLALHRKTGNIEEIAYALWLLAFITFSQGDPVKAYALGEESLIFYRETGDKRGIGYALVILGLATCLQGDYVLARSLLEEGLRMHKAVGDRRGVIWGLYGLGWAALAQSSYATAQALFEESLTILLGRLDFDYRLFVALCLEGLAGAVAVQGQLVWAIRLLGAAETLREINHTPLPDVARAAYEHLVAFLHAQVDEPAFSAAWREGRAMTPAQVLGQQVPIMPPEAVPAATKQPSSVKLSPTCPDKLTKREVEVLRLVAQGLTDVQVAERLTISPRTVHTHLSSIYSKLRITSRYAAMRYALDHKIV